VIEVVGSRVPLLSMAMFDLSRFLSFAARAAATCAAGYRLEARLCARSASVKGILLVQGAGS
jgi:hypothetical protein